MYGLKECIQFGFLDWKEAHGKYHKHRHVCSREGLGMLTCCDLEFGQSREQTGTVGTEVEKATWWFCLVPVAFLLNVK